LGGAFREKATSKIEKKRSKGLEVEKRLGQLEKK